MGRHAIIETATSLVRNVILWDGEIEWTPEEGFIAIESDAAKIGDSYANGEFVAPPKPTQAPGEVLELNTNLQESLAAVASQAMTPLLLSLQIGNATASETAAAKAWQAYYRKLKAVDLSAAAPAWPTTPD